MPYLFTFDCFAQALAVGLTPKAVVFLPLSMRTANTESLLTSFMYAILLIFFDPILIYLGIPYECP